MTTRTKSTARTRPAEPVAPEMPPPIVTARFEDLDGGQQDQVLNRLYDQPLHRVRAWAIAELGLDLSEADLEDAWQRRLCLLVLARQARAQRLSAKFARPHPRRPNLFLEAIRRQLQQELFLMLCNPNCDPARLRVLLELLQEIRQQDLAEEKHAFERQKHRDQLEQPARPGAKPSKSNGYAWPQSDLDYLVGKIDELVGLRPSSPPTTPAKPLDPSSGEANPASPPSPASEAL